MTVSRRISTMKKISERIAQPTPDQVREARERAGLTQTQAAELVSAAEKAAYKTWSGYEKQEGGNKRNIPLATWELFLLLTDQHPGFKLTARRGGWRRFEAHTRAAGSYKHQGGA